MCRSPDIRKQQQDREVMHLVKVKVDWDTFHFTYLSKEDKQNLWKNSESESSKTRNMENNVQNW